MTDCQAMTPLAIDKRRVRRSFERAAADYDRLAQLQRRVADRLLGYLHDLPITPQAILEIGTGTGYCARGIETRYPQARLIALDIAAAMLIQARSGLRPNTHLLCCDAEALALADNRFSLVVSNLSLQWCNDLRAALLECQRVLLPGGYFLATTFGGRTLQELSRAWRQSDGFSHVSPFIDRKDFEHSVERAGLRIRLAHSQLLGPRYPSVLALMRELKGIGAHNATANRARHLTAKGTLQHMITAYETAMPNGQIVASFEPFYIVAQKPPA